MKCETWTNVYACRDPDLAAEAFTETFLNVAYIHAPFKRIKCHSQQPKWMTPEFLALIDNKHHFINVYNKNQLHIMRHTSKKRIEGLSA